MAKQTWAVPSFGGAVSFNHSRNERNAIQKIAQN